MAAQYLYNVYTQTILFSTILGRVCDAAGRRTAQRQQCGGSSADAAVVVAAQQHDVGGTQGLWRWRRQQR
jgi:hypothetical protein